MITYLGKQLLKVPLILKMNTWLYSIVPNHVVLMGHDQFVGNHTLI